MKLSLIESDISRRDFLRKSGVGIGVGMLVSNGIPLPVAKDIVAQASTPSKFGIFKHLQDSMGAYNDAAHESANIAWRGLADFKREFGLDPALVFGPDQIGAGGMVSGRDLVQFFTKASEDGWEIMPEDENNWLLIKDNEEISVSKHGPGDSLDWSFKSVDSYNDFLKNWWDGWMEASLEPSSPEFRRTLAKYGINYWDRPDHVIEQALEELGESDPAEFEKLYGSVDNWLKLADARGVENPHAERQKLEPETYNPRNDDHIYGSSMHQPFESLAKRLDAIFAG